MNILILSDIHGNLEALTSVLINSKFKYDSVICLGDLIDYGPHSNEIVTIMKSLEKQKPFLCNICGNHENAIITDDYNHFSSGRGRECAKNTRKNLSEEAWTYINHSMNGTGLSEFSIGDKNCLAVHGSLKDNYWNPIKPGQELGDYQKYDYVFSGHSHLPHFFEVFFSVESPLYRNKKKTVFINPGSVGQPRNHSPLAQFAFLDTVTGAVEMCRAAYDIKREQSAFSADIDVFYRERLEFGI